MLFGVLSAAAQQGRELTVFNIVPINEGAEAQLAEDIVRIKNERIADVSLAMFTLVPEGTPPIDKMRVLAKRFKKTRELINGRAPYGILLQSTIGHGYRLNNPNNLEHFVSLTEAKPNPNKCCPLGAGTIKYMRDICRQAAELRPDHIMVDDDFRMYTNSTGCLCRLHLAEISRRLGYTITAEQARAHVYGTSAQDRRVSKIIDAVNIDSLCSLAEKMRAAVDEIDPKIPMSVCVCSGDIRYSARLGKIFAAKGQTPIVRINNARYAEANKSPRNFAKTMYSTMVQLPYVKGSAIVLAETDTLPHNRYGTSARSLHANYCGYLLYGCRGAKQWITSTSEFEPNGNEAYRKILAEHADFYESIAREVANVKHHSGFATPISKTPLFNFNPFRPAGAITAVPWAQTLCCVSGLPTNFAFIGDNPAMINKTDVGFFSDAEILVQLKRGMALDGGAAAELCRRGFGKYLGVEVSPLSATQVDREVVSPDPINGGLRGKAMVPSSNFVRLTPTSQKTRVLADFVKKPFAQDDKSRFQTVSPSATLFENEFGAKVLVFASDINGGGWGTYMRYPRKAFILGAFAEVEPFRIWYPFDAEMFVYSGTLEDGGELMGLFNFGWDVLDKIELAYSVKPASVKIMTQKGGWESVPFSAKDGLLTVNRKIEPMYPIVLKIGVSAK